MNDAVLRDMLIQAALGTLAEGLNHGTSGNVSVRLDEGFLVTPTGMPFDLLHPDDLVRVGMDGGTPPGSRVPSSEWRLHRDIYAARPDVSAIVHAHPRFCTTIACLREDLPAVHYMLAVTGADRVRCGGYATYGTAELGQAAVTALGMGGACLLANHGLVAVADSLVQALRVAREVEVVAEYWWRARAIGTPAVLSAAEMAEAVERFRGYGQPRRAPTFPAGPLPE